jgi:lysophospholipase L1-like esterase
MDKKILVILLIIAVIGDLIGLYVLYKANHYRNIILSKNREELDYGHLQSYQEENKSLTRAPDTVFYGASITKSMDFEKYFPGKNYLNRGVNGQYADQLLLRFKQDVIDLQPKRVVIKICSINMGANIPLDATKYYMKTMVEMAEWAGIRPYPATVVPAGKTYAEQYKDRKVVEKIVHFNEWLRGFAEGKSLDVVDYFAEMADEKNLLPDRLSEDGLHPNAEALYLMAKTANRVLDKPALEDAETVTGDAGVSPGE